MSTINREEAREIIIDKILFDRLDMGEVGVVRENINFDTQLFTTGEGSLGLDSVEALEVAVAVQQIFKFEIAKIDRAFFEDHCASIGKLADYVVERLNK